MSYLQLPGSIGQPTDDAWYQQPSQEALEIAFFGAHTVPTSPTKYWDGAAWVSVAAKVWDGAAWVVTTPKRRNGSIWEAA